MGALSSAHSCSRSHNCSNYSMLQVRVSLLQYTCPVPKILRRDLKTVACLLISLIAMMFESSRQITRSRQDLVVLKTTKCFEVRSVTLETKFSYSSEELYVSQPVSTRIKSPANMRFPLLIVLSKSKSMYFSS